jgi:2-iminobutanoate/2-iminopropanoate deaminase
MTSAALPISDAVVHGDLLFCSGQIGWDGSQVVEGFDAQFELATKNFADVLTTYGSSVEKLLKVNIYLADMADFDRLNELYAKFVGSARPARSCVQVGRLPRNALFEIEGVAQL